MLNSMKYLKSGNLKLVDTKLIYPLVRWCAGSEKDVDWCNTVNKYLFYCDSKIISGLLYLGLKEKNPFIKYPKASKITETKEFELKKALAKRFYFWSEQEFQRNLSNIEYINWEEVAMALGCDKKERKLLGLPEIKFKKQVITQEKVAKPKKTLFDF